MVGKDHDTTSTMVPSGRKPDERIVTAIQGRLQDGKLPCARAFELGRELSVPLIDVGYTADLLKIKISQCQLGLFGYEPKKCIVQAASSVDSALEESIQAGLGDGRLPCRTAFVIAKQHHLTRMDVSSACEHLEVKISSCQLGAFP